MGNDCPFCDAKGMKELEIYEKGGIRVIHNLFAFRERQMLFILKEHKKMKDMTRSEMRDLFEVVCLVMLIERRKLPLSLLSGFSFFCLEGKAAGSGLEHGHWHLLSITGIFNGLFQGPYKKIMPVSGCQSIQDLSVSEFEQVLIQVLEVRERMTLSDPIPDGFIMFFTDYRIHQEKAKEWGIYICPRYKDDDLIFGRSEEERKRDGILSRDEVLASATSMRRDMTDYFLDGVY